MKTGWCIKILRYWVKFSVYNVWDCECVAIIYKLFFFILSLCCILLVFSFFIIILVKKNVTYIKSLLKQTWECLYYIIINITLWWWNISLLIHFGTPLAVPADSYLDSFLWVGWTYILLIFPLSIPYFPFFQIAPWRIMPQEVCPNQSWYNAWLSWWYYIRGYLYMNLKFI